MRVTTAPASESTEVEEPVVVRLVDRDEPVGMLASEVAEVNRSHRSRSVLLIEAVRGHVPWAGVAQLPDDALLGRLATGLRDVRVGRGGH